MKKFSVAILFLFFLISNLYADEVVQLKNGQKAVLMDDFTWAYVKNDDSGFGYDSIKDNQIPDFLRGGIKCDAKTIKTAVEMYNDGWRYTMPWPKSNQARWGNSDGRTT